MEYQLWITDNKNQFTKYIFTNSKDAYLFYLENYATKKDFDYYENCCEKSLYDIKDDKNLIADAFRNVFSQKHHLYVIIKNKVGTLVPIEIDEY